MLYPSGNMSYLTKLFSGDTYENIIPHDIEIIDDRCVPKNNDKMLSGFVFIDFYSDNNDNTQLEEVFVQNTQICKIVCAATKVNTNTDTNTNTNTNANTNDKNKTKNNNINDENLNIIINKKTINNKENNDVNENINNIIKNNKNIYEHLIKGKPVKPNQLKNKYGKYAIPLLGGASLFAIGVSKLLFGKTSASI